MLLCFNYTDWLMVNGYWVIDLTIIDAANKDYKGEHGYICLLLCWVGLNGPTSRLLKFI